MFLFWNFTSIKIKAPVCTLNIKFYRINDGLLSNKDFQFDWCNLSYQILCFLEGGKTRFLYLRNEFLLELHVEVIVFCWVAKLFFLSELYYKDITLTRTFKIICEIMAL
jgi:hypothetical protein